MPYIGKTPLTGAYQLCDAITTSATATYNLTVGSSPVIPGAAQNCIVSLNGVVQAPVGAYTVSGSTIVFASTLSATDVIDFILILGNVFDIGKPTDGSVTNASVASNAAIALSKLATTGTMTFASTIGVGGATPAASGAGITFPASVSASSDANTLDDYEEGTFSPIISTGFTGTPVYSSTDNYGRYTKIGNRVYVHASVKIDSGITAAATVLQYGGLPFTSLNVAQIPGGFYFTYNLSWASGGTASFYMTLNANDTKFVITGTNGIGVNGNNASLTLQGTVLNYSGFYIV